MATVLNIPLIYNVSCKFDTLGIPDITQPLVAIEKLMFIHIASSNHESSSYSDASFQLTSKTTHPRDFGNLSKLSCAKQGNHYRSDPVRVQSTSQNHGSGIPTTSYHIVTVAIMSCDNFNQINVGNRANARCRGQKLCCGLPQRGILGRYRPQSAVSCSTLRERAA